MTARGRVRRVVVSALLIAAVAVGGVGWAEIEPTRAADNSVTVPEPPGLTVDAALASRSDLLSGSWVEQRPLKARNRLGLAILVGLSLLLAAALVTLTRPLPAPRSALRRRWSVALRAPPILRLS